ncbi:MAG TPA: DNA cytosine methyltransferase [Candidatus Angelobacter sp.]|nr:DNA cytosine methyltransferase [Candidatus Angelobacter sp.]
MNTSIELFAGAGGLALGLSQAGFRHKAVVELDTDACNTLRSNQERGFKLVRDWPIFQEDVCHFSFDEIGESVDLVAAGVPCQPWSLGGKHRGYEDGRNMFPQMLRAVLALRPRAFIIENVKGLLRRSFATYFEYITLMLSYPEIQRKASEDWPEHLARLERHHTSGKVRSLEYKVVYRLLNAANYGVPQKRERVFIVGFRSDLGIEWSFPESTHSAAALAVEQLSGVYWERHQVSKKNRPSAANAPMPLFDGVEYQPWRTVRDAIKGLPDPEKSPENKFPNHRFMPGARSYAGHTGSRLDEPAKTLKAGDHGVPGGENMIVFPDGKLRYLTVRESARVQTFPDEYVFQGSWTEAMRQLGNAVPVTLAKIIATHVRKHLRESEVSQNSAKRIAV